MKISLTSLTLLLLFAFSPLSYSGAETPMLKVRANKYHGYTRIVLEGPVPLILKGIVNQKGEDIIVNFEDTGFLLENTDLFVPYKKIKNTLVLSPERFREIKVTRLKSPARLVIDIYMDSGAEDIKKTADKTRFVKINTIIIDPGHGGYEYGIIKNTMKEKDTALDISKKLRAMLLNSYARCLLTRVGDQSVSLEKRADFSNTKHGDVFLSIHVGRHKGIVIYTPAVKNLPDTAEEDDAKETKDKAQALADAMQSAIKDSLGKDMVSIKKAPYTVLSKIEAPAMIIELPSFEDAEYTDEFNIKIANTIYKGLYLYEKDSED
ncbi:MAG: N-acetylmuramoyl-L-alanine amidase [Nitrospirae bacterium]|nr:N-acetylmuramoyl-L-alanine amidase [Nitrospirota bacterium]